MFKPSIRVKYGTHTHTTLSLKAKQTQQTNPPTTTTTQANLTTHDLHIYIYISWTKWNAEQKTKANITFQILSNCTLKEIIIHII